MDGAKNFLSNFWFEISAYILPGFVMIQLILLPIFKYIFFEFDIYSNYQDWFTIDYGKYKFADWIILLTFSYVVGMLISTLMFKVMDIKVRFFRYFNVDTGLYAILKSAPDVDRLMNLKVRIRNSIQTTFGIDGLEDDNVLRANCNLINQLLTMYLEEKSNYYKPTGRYYTRLSMAQNLSFAVKHLFQSKALSIFTFY